MSRFSLCLMEDALSLDFVSAFLEPASLVWESEFGEALKVEHGAVRSQPFRQEDIVVKVSVTGSLEGDVYYGFARGLALSLSEKIQGQASEEVDEMTVSVIEEVANMISGRTMGDLEAEGYRCDIAPPVLMDGSVVGLVKGADPSTIVHLTDHDERATIWADLAENANAAVEADWAAPEAPVGQSAIDDLFSSAA